MPRDYSITYSYHSGLTQSSYDVFLTKYFSEENQSKIVDEFKKEGLDGIAKSVTGSKDGLNKFLEFEVSPSFPDITRMKNLDAKQIKQLQNISTSLLKLHVTATPINDFKKIGSVIRNNYESVFPLDRVEHSLRSSVINW